MTGWKPAPRRPLVAALALTGAFCWAAPATAQSPEPSAVSRPGSWSETSRIETGAQRTPASTASESERGAESTAEPAARIVSPSAAFPTLTPAASSDESAEKDAPGAGSPQWSSPAITVASSLAVVLGLFAGLVWLTRRFGSKTGGGGTLPQAALEQLGSRAIDARTRIVMLRCGERILVVAQTAGGMHPLSEITEPAEVNRLSAACQSDSRQAFAQTIESLEKEPAAPGFVDHEIARPASRRGLFATG